MKKLFLVLLIFSSIIFMFSRCKKEATQCYTCYDTLGNELETHCGSDKQDAWEKAGHPMLNGSNTFSSFDNSCH